MLRTGSPGLFTTRIMVSVMHHVVDGAGTGAWEMQSMNLKKGHSSSMSIAWRLCASASGAWRRSR